MRQAGINRVAALLTAVALCCPSSSGLYAQSGGAPKASEPNYPTSPYHGMRDGDGRIIPCRCRAGGRDYRVGELVCMSTHVGTVLTRCDLEHNNTSWIPTPTPCEISGTGGRLAANPTAR